MEEVSGVGLAVQTRLGRLYEVTRSGNDGGTPVDACGRLWYDKLS